MTGTITIKNKYVFTSHKDAYSNVKRLSQWDNTHGRLLRSFYRLGETFEYSTLTYNTQGQLTRIHTRTNKNIDIEISESVLGYNDSGHLVTYEDHKGNIWQESWGVPFPYGGIIDLMQDTVKSQYVPFMYLAFRRYRNAEQVPIRLNILLVLLSDTLKTPLTTPVSIPQDEKEHSTDKTDEQGSVQRDVWWL